MTRRIWVGVGLVPAATLAAALVTGLAASSHSTARNAFVVKEPDAAWAEKAGVPEGPAATYEAQQAALRAYPGNEIPLSALQSSLSTAARLEKLLEPGGRAQRALQRAQRNLVPRIRAQRSLLRLVRRRRAFRNSRLLGPRRVWLLDHERVPCRRVGRRRQTGHERRRKGRRRDQADADPDASRHALLPWIRQEARTGTPAPGVGE